MPPLAALVPSPVYGALAAWHRANASSAGRVAVAYSGGADSTALLVEQARWTVVHGGPNLTPLWALHVHHGLQDAADAFVDHCRATCAEMSQQVQTRLCVAHARVQRTAGASIEAQAREARYDALAGLARENLIDTVLLAQHADDQAETLLIALGRGAGMAGLAGMAPTFCHGGVRFVRPMLDVAAPAVRHWLINAQLPFLDDPSNRDERHTRNRLRHRVMPVLERALPDFRATFARTARLAHQAQQLLDELAVEDLGRVGDPPAIRALQGLSPDRQANLLRCWLKRRHAAIGSEAQMLALVGVVRRCMTRGHGIHIKVGQGYVERDGERLTYRPFL
ncbi:MAG: tRNA lysidine(34) synthetase TilS [Aquincola sp.]|nr:tRNA lysidine(34) synthetase TilS [Aquincola sp.]